MPARSGGDILFAAKMGAKAESLAFVGFETLPWACRFTDWGKRATILGTKGSILAAVTPESESDRAISVLQGLLGVFPRVLKSPNNLGISLRNPGQVIHPGVMYGRWCSEKWDGKPLTEKPLFYQGVDEFTEQVLTGLSDEVQAVRKKVEEMIPGYSLKDACTLHQWYLDSYSGQMADPSTLRGSMNTNSAYRGLTHPMKQEADGTFMPDLKYRYVAEDVPTGLCFTKGVAELIEVPTPTMDKVLMWAQVGGGAPKAAPPSMRPAGSRAGHDDGWTWPGGSSEVAPGEPEAPDSSAPDAHMAREARARRALRVLGPPHADPCSAAGSERLRALLFLPTSQQLLSLRVRSAAWCRRCSLCSWHARSASSVLVTSVRRFERAACAWRMACVACARSALGGHGASRVASGGLRRPLPDLHSKKAWAMRSRFCLLSLRPAAKCGGGRAAFFWARLAGWLPRFRPASARAGPAAQSGFKACDFS
ncbi:unnamed protein product [Prorocentrum cordatum]|uniref:Opine dehydrogenase domain-containing protein n=1 Tax=Prorocentrum cordatum TaxID=2364126 RepID=A0ABN9QYK9_9DINO|nr:unnamed protein product [Polarella glacialis]